MPTSPLDAVLTASIARAQPIRGRRAELAARALRAAMLRQLLAEGRSRPRRAAARRSRTASPARARSAPHGRVVAPIHDAVVAISIRPTTRRLGERLAVVATGGYGRGTLAPGSDVDLLFLLPYKQTAWSESVVEAMLYVLWDLKLKVGHATRSRRRVPARGRGRHDDPHVAAGSALLLGDAVALRGARAALRPRARAGHGGRVRRREARASASARVTKAGASRYLVEPNVKDGKGGLRDLNTLFWIAKYVYRVQRSRDDLVEAGLFTQEEFRPLRALRRVSVARALPACTSSPGRAEERLTFDLQRRIAERIGYPARGGLSAVERFMKPISWSPRTWATSPPSSAPRWRRATPSRAPCSTGCSAASAAARRRDLARATTSSSTTTASTWRATTCSSAIPST